MAEPTMAANMEHTRRALASGCEAPLRVGRFLTICTTLLLTSFAFAHETDQHTVPAGREFAEMGPVINRWFYTNISRGVDAANAEIKSAIESHQSESAIHALQSGPQLAHKVNKAFPWAMDVIEGWDNDLMTPAMMGRFPGYVTGYKHQFVNIYQHTHAIIDPRQFFRIWLGRTLKVYGHYIGTDKLGHLTDNGMNLYNTYLKAKDAGESDEKAVAAAIRLSTDDRLFGEKGMVGYGSAGDYSNGDLISNYIGLLFYRNLYEPVSLKGSQQPALVARDGSYWQLAPHVRPDSDFMEVYFDDGLDEALNPGHFEAGMRNALRTAVRERREIILEHYRDEHGCRRARPWFDHKLEEMKTYYGAYYGHFGPYDQLVSIPNTLFPAIDEKGNANTPNQYGETPLHAAAANGDAAAIRRLLARSANVAPQLRTNESYNSDWGSTPLHFAAASGNREAVQLLLSAGADVNARNDKGGTPLHRAVKFPDIAQLLLERGARVEIADGCGRTALHWCANDSDDCRAVAALLIDRGAAVAAKDRDGRTPLHLAAACGRDPVAAMLLAAHAEVNAPDLFGATPLHLAAAQRRSAVLETLARAGANANAADAFGGTPLHAAARVGSQENVAVLLRSGGSRVVVNSYGRTPEAVARATKFPAVAAMLMPAAPTGAQPAATRATPPMAPQPASTNLPRQ